MKKYLFPVSVSLILGVSMAYFIIKQYETMPTLAVSSEAQTLYYIRRGVYSDMQNMENNMKEFTNYIYNVENNEYHTYIGITTSKENSLKIQISLLNSGIFLLCVIFDRLLIKNVILYIIYGKEKPYIL